MPAYVPNLQFPIYSGWTRFTPVIPKIYWDAYSQEQIIKELCKNFDKVEQYLDYIAALMNEWNMEFDEQVEAEFEALWNAVYNEFEEDVIKWINTHMEFIYNHTIKQIFFGLDDEGHLVAYVPDGWDDIIFSTPMEYTDQDTYGRLILSYDV